MQPTKKTSNTNELAHVVSQIPPVTRAMLAGVVFMTVVSSMGLIPHHWLYFSWYHAFMKLQLWRVYTSCFILPHEKMAAVFWIFNLYSYSSHLESVHFRSKNNVDYLFLLWSLIGSVVISVTVLRLSSSFDLSNAFMGALACMWSIKNWNVTVMFYGLFPLKGKYEPLFQLFLAFVFERYPGGFELTLLGYTVCYLYHCLDTRSLGPLYGYIAGKSNGYGLTGSGHFRAPWWFSAVCDFFGKRNYQVNVAVAKSASYQGQGRRLGSTHFKKPDPANIATLRSARENGPSTKTTSDAATTGFFPGRGARVGSKD